eukprot:scaffold4841_cov121-Isochrysis_galbana.AAC.5
MMASCAAKGTHTGRRWWVKSGGEYGGPTALAQGALDRADLGAKGQAGGAHCVPARDETSSPTSAGHADTRTGMCDRPHAAPPRNADRVATQFLHQAGGICRGHLQEGQLAHRPLLLDDLDEDDVELRHEDALSPEDLLARRFVDDEVDYEVFDPHLSQTNAATQSMNEEGRERRRGPVGSDGEDPRPARAVALVAISRVINAYGGFLRTLGCPEAWSWGVPEAGGTAAHLLLGWQSLPSVLDGRLKDLQCIEARVGRGDS